MTTIVHSPNDFPTPSDLVNAKVSSAKTESKSQIEREKSLTLKIRLYAILFFIVVLIEFAVGFGFSTALIQNGREELTTYEQILRAIGSMAFMATMLAIGSVGMICLKPEYSGAARIFAFSAFLIIGTAIFMIASALGYETLHGSLSKLWGAPSSSDIPLDATLQSNSTDQTPFWLRLASAALLIGVGFLAALLKEAWDSTESKRTKVRQLLAQYKVILDHNTAYETKRKAYLSKIEEHKTVLDPDYQHARAFSAVFNKIKSYRDNVEAMRPNPASLANMDKATYDRRIQDAGKVDVYLKSADTVAARTTDIEALVNKFFPRSTVTPTPTPTV